MLRWLAGAAAKAVCDEWVWLMGGWSWKKPEAWSGSAAWPCRIGTGKWCRRSAAYSKKLTSTGAMRPKRQRDVKNTRFSLWSFPGFILLFGIIVYPLKGWRREMAWSFAEAWWSIITVWTWLVWCFAWRIYTARQNCRRKYFNLPREWSELFPVVLLTFAGYTLKYELQRRDLGAEKFTLR